MSFYNYCTRCGGELTDKEEEKAREWDQTPPLCSECIMGLFRSIPDVVERIIDSVFGNGDK